jgi:pimeloyl-ACP methyl ester carboxylesterase
MGEPSTSLADRLDFRAEVARFDRLAEVRTWAGPRHRMTYRTLGEGPPLVLLPGLASTYRGYSPTLLRLAERFRTIQFDYPGEHPDDGADLARITHDDLVDDLLGLMDHLGLKQAYPFGLSFGSTITLGAIHRVPGRFPKAALQGGFARRRLKPTERLALAVGRRISGKSSRLPFHEKGLSLGNKVTFPGDTPDRWDHYVEENGLTPIASLSHRLDLLDRLDLRPTLPRIEQEVLVIHGTADRIVLMASHDELVAGLPRGQSLLMAGVGHQPHWTHPRELAGLVGDFFEPDVRSTRDSIAPGSLQCDSTN